MTDSIRLLIVDDDLAVLGLLEEIFKDDASLKVTTLSDSQEACLRLERERFDLIITDLMMPKVDGLRLLERAVELNPEVLVVVVTGYASLETTLQAIHAGVYDYITKPFRIEEFRLLVHNAAARIRLVQDNRMLRVQNEALQSEVKDLRGRRAVLDNEVARLREELGRRQDLLVQTGALPGGGEGGRTRVQISSYEKGLETSSERFDREFHHLEQLFSEGRLTPSEFELARQRLRTRI